MLVNADFAKRAVVHAMQTPWLPSPMPGVERRMLDRVGAEVARATSIVKYAPQSAFSAHRHDGGEEFLVLEGVFQDEHGDYPVGSYVRNPPGTSHVPSSESGCVIFVKLHQFKQSDRFAVRCNTSAASALAVPDRPGVKEIPLHEDERERVRIELWPAGTTISLNGPSGLEILTLDGSFIEDSEVFNRHSWLRLPPGAKLAAVTGPDGARVFIKSGHLAHLTDNA